MTVGIVGLGLIGGSLAKAYREAGETVLAADRDRSVLDFAILNGTVASPLTAERLPDCDLILLAVSPEAAIEWFRENAGRIGSHPVVIDCCGTKRTVCAACFPLAAERGVTFLGGHPMAGNHNSGFKYARGNLFHGAPMVLVPADRDDIRLLDRARELRASAASPSPRRRSMTRSSPSPPRWRMLPPTPTSRAPRPGATRAFPPGATRI